MSLNNCDINLILTWSKDFISSEIDRVTIYTITDRKLYVLVITLSTQDINYYSNCNKQKSNNK